MVTLLSKWTRDEVWAQNMESMNIQRHTVAVYAVDAISVQQVQKWCHDFANGWWGSLMEFTDLFLLIVSWMA